MLSNNLELQAGLHRSPEHPSSSVLGFDTGLPNSNWGWGWGKGEERDEGRRDRQLMTTNLLEYGLWESQDGSTGESKHYWDSRNNHCSSLYSQQQTLFPKHSYTSKSAGHPHWKGRRGRRSILCSGHSIVCILTSIVTPKDFKVNYSHKQQVLRDLSALIHSNERHTDFHSSESYLSSHPNLYSYQFFNVTLNSQCLEIKTSRDQTARNNCACRFGTEPPLFSAQIGKQQAIINSIEGAFLPLPPLSTKFILRLL